MQFAITKKSRSEDNYISWFEKKFASSFISFSKYFEIDENISYAKDLDHNVLSMLFLVQYQTT